MAMAIYSRHCPISQCPFSGSQSNIFKFNCYNHLKNGGPRIEHIVQQEFLCNQTTSGQFEKGNAGTLDLKDEAKVWMQKAGCANDNKIQEGGKKYTWAKQQFPGRNGIGQPID
jgi:hypothetical protein